MESYAKPDLVVHPSFERTLLDDYELYEHFNVLRVSTLERRDAVAHLVGDRFARRVELALEPFYRNNACSGTEPSCTSYCLTETTTMYAVDRRAPRYVVWTKRDPLAICATSVDRVDSYGLHEALRRAKSWATPITRVASVVVFDLDETLVDERGQPLRHAGRALEYARRCYDLVVLWSHGSPLHVDECARAFVRDSAVDDAPVFDLVLSHDGDDKACKNLLHLYNYFPGTTFAEATLVDDSPFNWTPEYGRMLIPHRCKSLRRLLPLLSSSPDRF